MRVWSASAASRRADVEAAAARDQGVLAETHGGRRREYPQAPTLTINSPKTIARGRQPQHVCDAAPDSASAAGGEPSQRGQRAASRRRRCQARRRSSSSSINHNRRRPLARNATGGRSPAQPDPPGPLCAPAASHARLARKVSSSLVRSRHIQLHNSPLRPPPSLAHAPVTQHRARGPLLDHPQFDHVRDVGGGGRCQAGEMNCSHSVCHIDDGGGAS